MSHTKAKIRKAWTSDETEILREHYFEPQGPAIVAQMTGRSVSSAYQRALSYHLHRGRRSTASERRDVLRKLAEPLPIVELQTGKCPGKGSGICGKILRMEHVHEAEGYCVAGVFDLICEAGHRFPIPEKK